MNSTETRFLEINSKTVYAKHLCKKIYGRHLCKKLIKSIVLFFFRRVEFVGYIFKDSISSSYVRQYLDRFGLFEVSKSAFENSWLILESNPDPFMQLSEVYIGYLHCTT